jgi:hypothetical protein
MGRPGMNSPCPGMDLFIEACGLWEDFHSHLIEGIGEALAGALPEHYVVRTGRRAYLSFEEEHRERFIEIYQVGRTQRLVTSIEVLSPSNKRPGTPGWDLYQRKRQSLVLSGVNLVEIDLVRSGERMPMLDPWPNSPYSLQVTRPNRDSVCTVWAGRLSAAIASPSRAVGEARSGCSRQSSADDRLDLSALPLRAQHRLSQAADAAIERRRPGVAETAVAHGKTLTSGSSLGHSLFFLSRRS